MIITTDILSKALYRERALKDYTNRVCVDCVCNYNLKLIEKLPPIKHLNTSMCLIWYSKDYCRVYNVCQFHASAHPVRYVSIGIVQLTEKDIFYLQLLN